MQTNNNVLQSRPPPSLIRQEGAEGGKSTFWRLSMNRIREGAKILGARLKEFAILNRKHGDYGSRRKSRTFKARVPIPPPPYRIHFG